MPLSRTLKFGAVVDHGPECTQTQKGRGGNKENPDFKENVPSQGGQ